MLLQKHILLNTKKKKKKKLAIKDSTLFLLCSWWGLSNDIHVRDSTDRTTTSTEDSNNYSTFFFIDRANSYQQTKSLCNLLIRFILMNTLWFVNADFTILISTTRFKSICLSICCFKCTLLWMNVIGKKRFRMSSNHNFKYTTVDIHVCVVSRDSLHENLLRNCHLHIPLLWF